MDEEQRSRQAEARMEDEVEQAAGLPAAEAPSPAPEPQSAGATGRPPRAAWLEVGLVLALPLVGFFVARLSGLLVGAVVGIGIVAALRLSSRP